MIQGLLIILDVLASRASIRDNSFSVKNTTALLIKITAAQNKVALSYYTVRGLYFLAVIFVSSGISTLVFDYFWYHVSKCSPIIFYDLKIKQRMTFRKFKNNLYLRHCTFVWSVTNAEGNLVRIVYKI